MTKNKKIKSWESSDDFRSIIKGKKSCYGEINESKLIESCGTCGFIAGVLLEKYEKGNEKQYWYSCSWCGESCCVECAYASGSVIYCGGCFIRLYGKYNIYGYEKDEKDEENEEGGEKKDEENENEEGSEDEYEGYKIEYYMVEGDTIEKIAEKGQSDENIIKQYIIKCDFCSTEFYMNSGLLKYCKGCLKSVICYNCKKNLPREKGIIDYTCNKH